MNIMTRDPNGSSNKPQPARSVAPPVDVFENGEQVLVIADIPGVGPDAVDVRIENGTLTIDAKRVAGGDRDAPALAREYEEQNRSRSFRIPDGIDTGRITAEAKNGTLVVVLPKVAAVKPRKVEVRAS